MRTTLSIRDDLYDAARRRAFEERRTLGDVINELVERGLVGAAEAGPPRRLGTFTGRITVRSDFDDDLPEMTVALDEPVEP